MPLSTPPALTAQFFGDSEHFCHVYQHLIAPAVRRCNLEPLPPKATGSDLIHAHIFERLRSADLVLCDMSAHNPNVFFELGVRTALDKPVALIADEQTVVPFDTSILGYHRYDPSLRIYSLEEEIAKLSAHIHATLESGLSFNPFWRTFSQCGERYGMSRDAR